MERGFLLFFATSIAGYAHSIESPFAEEAYQGQGGTSLAINDSSVGNMSWFMHVSVRVGVVVVSVAVMSVVAAVDRSRPWGVSFDLM